MDDKTKESEKKAAPAQPLEGEGSYTGAADYEREARKFAEEEDVEGLAEKAREEVEADEPGYRKAEEEGKRHAAEEDPELERKAKSADEALEPPKRA